MIEIFSSAEEFRQIVPVNDGFNLDELKPDIDTAFREYVEPFLSREQYDASVAYTTGANLAKHQELLSLVKKACGYLGEWLFFPFAKVQLTGTSVSYTEDKERQASAEDKKHVEDRLLANGLRSVEDMLRFLEANKTVFTVWADSTGYKKYTAFFVRTADEFGIIEGSRLVYMKLMPYLGKAQVNMREILPAVSYDKLKARDYGTENPAELEKWTTLLEDYVQPISANRALAAGLSKMAIHITPEGKYAAFDNTRANMSRGYLQLATERLEMHRDELLSEASDLTARMQNFIRSNATLFGYQEPEAPAREAFTNTEEHASKFFGSFR